MPDAVVIGSGPNGLVAANHLADAGWSVLVLEAAADPGGAVRTAEITLPGFRHDVFSAFYPLARVSPAMSGLGLEDHGLRWLHSPLALAHPLRDGRCASVSTDVDATGESLDQFAPGDSEAWARMIAGWDRVGGPFLDAMLGPFPPLRSAAALGLRLGAGGTVRLVRHLLLPVRRMAEEMYRGEGGALLLGGCALHADLSPEAVPSGVYGWLLSCLAQRAGFPVPEGGAGALVVALVRRLEARGGRVQCNSRADAIIVRAGRAVGVRLGDGTEVDARRAVLADVSAPDLYRRLLAPDDVPAWVSADLGRFEWDVATVKVDWALDRPVPWSAPEAGRAGTVHVADDFDNLTEVSAHLAMGLLPARPFLLFGQQSGADPTRCPPGAETAWAYTHVPRRLKGDAAGRLDVSGGHADPGWLPAFVDRIEERVEALAPGFRGSVMGRHCLAPAGFADRDANLDLGAINGGTSQLHQQLIFRPLPGWGRPETPVAALYLASASAHPGGGVHGAAGANAASAAMRPFPRARSAVLGKGWPVGSGPFPD